MTSRSLFLALALGVLAATGSAQTVLRVDDDAAPGGDGTSWALAFHDLQDALAVSTPGDQLWVAEGMYRPSVPVDPADPRTATFHLPPGCELYGGFAGNEGSLGQRAGSFVGTVLSGDLGVVGSAVDNAYRVVLLDSNPQNRLTRIDGFQIRDGRADGALGSPRRGAGVFVTLAGTAGFGVRLDLRNCLFRSNFAVTGGALGVEGVSTVEVTACRFSQNVAKDKGGAVIVQTSSLRVTSSVFDSNSTSNKGGAVYLTSIEQDDPVAGPSVRFVNSLFVRNRARRGGVAFINGSGVTSGRGTWGNCVLDRNVALEQGGAFFARTGAQVPAELSVTNSILWRNRAPSDPQVFGPAAVVHHCVVQGGYLGAGNLSVDPGFVSPATLDYRTVAGSPAHDAGDNAVVLLDLTDLDLDGVVLEPVPFDFAGNARFQDDALAPDTGLGSSPLVDIGMFEF